MITLAAVKAEEHNINDLYKQYNVYMFMWNRFFFFNICAECAHAFTLLHFKPCFSRTNQNIPPAHGASRLLVFLFGVNLQYPVNTKLKPNIVIVVFYDFPLPLQRVDLNFFFPQRLVHKVLHIYRSELTTFRPEFP